ncbi:MULTISPECIES: TetR/AcrR family transcriptional regulator [unclassified Streptomyces]|uniref:TetR/AcrR family transcriptional regulator n=1 Tax=unclassified Streptomyces TaxID=2593676 RepID=UPI0038202398
MSNPTDPRAARSRAAILIAARSLLLDEGPAAITHQRVAQKAGVGRATVYRHWSQPGHLLHDAMTGIDMPFFHNPRTPVRPWLRTHLQRLADSLTTPQIAGVLLTLMQGALRDPEIAAQRDACHEDINQKLRNALALAVADHEIEMSADPHDLSSMLVGPVLYHTAMRGSTVPPHLIEQLIDGLGQWHEPPAAPGGPGQA